MDVESSQATVLTHFYRGELGRMMIWRERLDRTTNWAIIAVTGVVSYFWTNEAFLHAGLYIGNAVLFLLLMIESRRYVFYDAYRARIRMLEAHWILPHVVQKPPSLESDWREVLGTDLVRPALKISLWEGMSRRLLRNYVWMFAILFFAWVGKLWTASLPIPNAIVWAPHIVVYLGLVALMLLGLKERRASGEFSVHRPGSSNKWKI